jgi:hypothetical protein
MISKDEDNQEMKNNLQFGFSCCQSSLKTVAISKSGRLMACGGIDERIRLFNLIDGKSIGEISNQVGAITSLKFFNDAFLFSSSEVK